jgi:hypothetical protein
MMARGWLYKLDFNTREEFLADRLGSADIYGWDLAASIMLEGPIDVDGDPSISFARLNTIAFHSWDDGRWEIYRRKREEPPSSYLSIDEMCRHHIDCLEHNADPDNDWIGVWPSEFIDRIRNEVFFSVLSSRSITVCQGDPTVPGDVSGLGSMEGSTGLHVIHEEGRVNAFHGYRNNRTRFYMKSNRRTIRIATDFLNGNRSNSMFGSYAHSMLKAYERAVETGNISKDTGLITTSIPLMELCIVPEIPGDEVQIQGVRMIKEMFETYHEAQAKIHVHAKACLGSYKILIEDEVPPCPGCGSIM